MSDLVSIIKDIQRATGADVDGVFGIQSARRVLNALQSVAGVEITHPREEETLAGGEGELDERTIKNILTLDARLRDRMIHFALLANATAATFGCRYVMTDGNRSLAGQEAIYAQGRTVPGKIVSYAKPGQSWHNLKAAGDFGVFRGKAYLDQTDPAAAERVHLACAAHAKACGLTAGAYWKKQDLPHYQAAELADSPKAADRAKFKEKGSVL